MNKHFDYNQQTYRLLYLRYKKFIPSVITILISISVFFLVLIPEYQDIQSMQADLAQKQNQTKVLDENVTLLNGVDENALSDDVQTATKALPPDKDFAGMLTAVTTAASLANVKLADFGFTVGDLSTESAKLQDQLAIQMDLSVDGGIQGAQRYISELSKRLPLDEIITEQTNQSQSTIQVSFFYQPFRPDSNDGTSPVVKTPADDLEQVRALKSWLSTPVVQSTQSAATESAK